MSPEYKKLYRARDNRVIGGVCGGLGEYLGIDPTIVRIIYILVALWFGSGIIAYIIFLILVPEEPTENLEKNRFPHSEDSVLEA
jgi:phage shock protein PspC (stress-responsive transcriptional regulator)